jgi:hypothetical protein
MRRLSCVVFDSEYWFLRLDDRVYRFCAFIVFFWL